MERLLADRADAGAVKRALENREFDVAFDISAYTTEALIPAIEALEGRVGRYVFCSTIAVYERSDSLPILESQPLSRDPSRSSQYGVDKVACEEYLAERWRARAFPYTVLRPCIVYGPHNSSPSSEFSFFARLRRKRPILIPGDGSNFLHFVHAGDLAQAFLSVSESGSSLGQAYNMAGPEAVSLKGYVNLLGKIVGVEPEVVVVPPDMVDDRGAPSSIRYPWRRTAFFSTRKAQEQLGFHPRPMSLGMAEAYRWYLTEGLDDRPWDFSDEDSLMERPKP